MPNTDPIDINFLINSDEVKAMAEKVKAAVRGVTQDAATQTEKMGTSFDNAFKGISDILSKSFGTEKVQQLSKELEGVTDEGQQLGKILQFIKDNLSGLNLDPQSTEKVTTNIERMEEAISQSTMTSQEFGQNTAQSFDISTMSVEQMESAVDGLIEKQGMLQRAMTQTNNPKLLEQYNQGLQQTVEEMNALGEALDKANAKKFEADNSQASTSPAIMETQVNNTKMLTRSMQGLYGAVTATTLSLQMLGGENNALGQTMMKLFSVYMVLMGAMDAVRGAKELGNAVTLISQQITGKLAASKAANIVATEGETAATITQTGATEGATAAQTALNTAMDANPIGIIILAVTALATAIVLLSDNTQELKDIQDALNKVMDDSLNIYQTQNEVLKQNAENHIQQLKNELAMLQARGSSQAQVAEKQNEIAQAELNYSNVFKKSADEQLKSMQPMLDAWGLQVKKIEDIQPAIQTLQTKLKGLDNDLALNKVAGASSNFAGGEAGLSGWLGFKIFGPSSKNLINDVDTITGQIKILQGLFNSTKNPFQQNEGGAQGNANASDATATKAAADLAMQNAIKDADAVVVAKKEGTKQWLNAELNAINVKEQADIKAAKEAQQSTSKIIADAQKAKEDAQRKFDTQQLTDQESLAKATLAKAKEGSQEQFNAQIALIESNAQKEVIAAQGNAAKIKDINAEKDKAIADTTKKYTAETSATEIQTEMAATNTRLTNVQKGSEEELQLKKKLIDEKAQYDIVNATATINNEQLLAAKITEIHAKEIEDKKKADDDYAKYQQQLAFNRIDNAARNKNLPYLATLNDPTATQGQRASAQLSIDKNNYAANLQDLTRAYNDLINAQNRGSNNVREFQNAYDKLNDKVKENATLINNDVKAIAQIKIQNIIQGLSQIGGILGQLANDTQSWGGALSSITGTLGNVVNQASSFQSSLQQAQKDFAKDSFDMIGGIAGVMGAAGAAFSAVTTVVSAIQQAQQQAEQARINAIKQQNQLLNDQYNTLKKITGVEQLAAYSQFKTQALQDISNASGQFMAELGPELAFLTKEQINQIIKLRKEAVATGDWDAFFSYVDDNVKKMTAAGADVYKAMKDNWDLIQQSVTDTKEALTGMSFSDLESQLVDLFQQGKISAEDFADTFQTLMQDAVIASFKREFLDKQLQGFYDEVADMLKNAPNNVLSEQQISDLKAKYGDLMTGLGDQFQQLEKITGVSFGQTADTTQQGLSGAIQRSMTEDTANELAGIFRGQYDVIKREFDVVSKALDVQLKIEANTANSLIQLQLAVGSLQKIETNTKPATTTRDSGIH